jgi:capsular polysaccharide biosynthesis protein
MSETNIIISNHGAGLTNMIFMPDNSKVIELKPDANNINNCFFNLAIGLDHEYYYTINKGNNSDVQRSHITVDLEKLENILNHFY